MRQFGKESEHLFSCLSSAAGCGDNLGQSRGSVTCLSRNPDAQNTVKLIMDSAEERDGEKVRRYHVERSPSPTQMSFATSSFLATSGGGYYGSYLDPSLFPSQVEKFEEKNKFLFWMKSSKKHGKDQ